MEAIQCPWFQTQLVEIVAKISPGPSERKQTLPDTTEGLLSLYFKKSTSDGKQARLSLENVIFIKKVLHRLAVVWTY